MPAIKETELKKHMDSMQLGCVYMLYGAEKHMIKRAAKKLMKTAGGEFSEFNLNEFSNESALENIVDSAVALPLMSERKCTVLSDYNLEDKTADEIKAFTELVKNMPETTTLVMYYPTLEFEPKKAAKWRNIIKAVDAVGYSVEFKRRGSSELTKLMMKSAERAGCTMSSGNAAMLVEYVGGDLKALLNEMGKLTAFASGGEITTQMIEDMVPKSLETTVFILSDALVSGDYEKAYGCLDTLIANKEEPVPILAVLSSAYVDIFRVKTAVANRMPHTSPKNYGDYRGKEFRLDKAERMSRKLSLEQTKESLNALLEADMKLKGSRLDSRLVLDGLIAKLLLVSRGEQSA